MVEIGAMLVKQLRDRTGAGMMDCKRALTECAGDIESAVDWLRKKGFAAAAKKAGRVAAEGLVGVATAERAGALVEVNSETDFVARNQAFQIFVRTLSQLALDVGADLTALKDAPYPETGRTVAEELTHMVATIGENIALRRSVVVGVAEGVIASYMHGQVAPGLGKIGVIVALESAGDREQLAALGKNLAMHVAATSPQSTTVDDLDPAMVQRERAILAEQARGSGKPENIVEKMVEGRLRKFYEEAVLLEQTYVIDGESKVAKVIEAAAEAVGAPIKLSGFARFARGEGIEQQATDFATEVAAQLGG